MSEAHFEHEHSQSMKALDPAATELFWERFKRNQAYYEAKWGGSRGHETYAVPFGGRRASVPAKVMPKAA